MIGSSFPSLARCVRSIPYCSRADFSGSPPRFIRCVPPGGCGRPVAKPLAKESCERYTSGANIDRGRLAATLDKGVRGACGIHRAVCDSGLDRVCLDRNAPLDICNARIVTGTEKNGTSHSLPMLSMA